MPGTTRQKCGTKCENILMADTCVQPCLKNAAFHSNWRSFPRHVVRHAVPEGSVPLRVPRFLHSLVAVSPPETASGRSVQRRTKGHSLPRQACHRIGRPSPIADVQVRRGLPRQSPSSFVRSGRRSVQRSGDRPPVCGWPEPSRWRSWWRKKSP